MFYNNTTFATTSKTTLAVFPTAGARNYLRLRYIPGINWGTTYTVTVRAMKNGVWGSYGAECSFTYGGAKSYTINNFEGQEEGFDINEAYMELNSYPNPFSNNATINIESSEDIDCGLEVFNITGQAVYSTTIHTNTPIEIGNDFRPGIYIVRVNNNGKVITNRIIKTN
ncbi:MAG: hypothetical protein A2033_00395 [Bacteroidetes bacterium GWA2_31_9]|nr:MAG: hypothetical protein A2033_00395 [Bacteroidetes bacterium GWA2_31_9]